MKHYPKELLIKILKQRMHGYQTLELDTRRMEYTDQDYDIDYEIVHYLEKENP